MTQNGKIVLFTLVAFFIFALAGNALAAALTETERLWLEEHDGDIVLHFDRKFPPVEFLSQEGEYTGLAADMVALLERRLGVHFRKQADDWPRILNLLKGGAPVISAAATRTEKREDFAFFTAPYVEIPMVIVTNRKHGEGKTLEDFGHKKVVVVDDFVVEEVLREKYSDFFDIVEVKGFPEGLRKVSFGEADAMVLSLAAASYYIEHETLTNLHVAGNMGVSFSLSFSVSKKYPVLFSILSKTLEGIPAEEFQAITEKWVGLRYISPTVRKTLNILQIALLAGVVAVAIVSLNSLWLRKKLRERTGQLSQSEGKVRALIDNAPVGIFTSTLDGRYLHLNQKMANIFGYGSTEEMMERVQDIHMDIYVNPHDRLRIVEELEKAGSVVDHELQVKHADGGLGWISLSLRRTEDDNGMRVFEGFCQDITDRKKAHTRLEYEVNHDSLTQLGNRRQCIKRIYDMLVRNHLGGMALLYFDICRFSNINHAYGHRWGDELLTFVAERLTRMTDYEATAHRVGGDQFALLFRSRRPREAMAFARRVHDAVCRPYRLDREEVDVEFAFGLAFCSEPEECVDKILSQAAIAHMRAKKAKDSSIVMYDARIHQNFLRELFLGKAIPQGMLSNEFFLEFQPVIDIGQGKFYGMEALLRWESGQHGAISPAEFIPIVEENDQISFLGEYALEQACRFWQSAGFTEEGLILSANVSGKQFAQQGFFKRLQNILERTGMPPCFLKLEVTETALMENARETVAKLEALRSLGVQISIDDFGTGYSSLDYLRRFSADTMKIDMSFIQKMESDGKSYELVRAMIDLAKTFDMTVIAEGVETAGQSRLLKDLGCTVHQGYFYSRPLPQADAPDFIRQALQDRKTFQYYQSIGADC